MALVYIHQVERCPGGSEMAYWVGRRQAGMTRLHLAEAVDRSPEALDGVLPALFARVGVRRASPPPPSGTGLGPSSGPAGT